MISLAATSVNGGYAVTPHVVEKIIDSDKNVVESFIVDNRKQVISESTSASPSRNWSATDSRIQSPPVP